MAAITAPSWHMFTLEEITALADKEGTPLEECSASIVDNEDGTHTYTVTAQKKKRGKTTPEEKVEQEQLEGYLSKESK
jgi:hypothetical protein